jgi:hypothetical protein
MIFPSGNSRFREFPVTIPAIFPSEKGGGGPIRRVAARRRPYHPPPSCQKKFSAPKKIFVFVGDETLPRQKNLKKILKPAFRRPRLWIQKL